MAFERVCLQHIEQIKKALGFFGVISTAHSWTRKGAQIDLLIDRNDKVINICVKYSKGKYALDNDEIQKMQDRVVTFMEETKTTKSIHLTMITTYGLTAGSNTNAIQSQLTMNDLFS